MRNIIIPALLPALVKALMATAALAAPAPPTAPPNAATKAANATLAQSLDFSDTQDFDFAARGFIAARADPVVRNANGDILRDFREDARFTGPAPAGVNPSLWRNAQLVSKHGLFKVMDGIWQIRGFDLSVMTVIAGKTGWIIVDPLTVEELATAALALANTHLGARPVAAIIYTHSHADHFGGAGGIVSADAQVPIYAPQGFMDHAVAENVIAGGAMIRRVDYMFGQLVPHTPEGSVSAGLGPVRAGGTIGLIPPNIEITPDTLNRTIDGIRFEFQLTPGTEAPAEMNFYLPDMRALCMAENANAAMHNILTPRGALVRDAQHWAAELLASRRAYAGRSDVMFTSHFWPRWGSEEIDEYLLTHAQAYAFLHNETVRLMNTGLDATEIAEAIALPPALGRAWYNRGHYGDLKFNARAVYQRYLGAFNGDPATLDPLPRDVLARKWVEALGGADRVSALAADAAAKGDDRWATTLYSQLVRAGDETAKPGLAASFEQLAMRAESAVWRNFYLSGAAELRSGIAPPDSRSVNNLGANLRMSDLLGAISVRILPEKAATKTTIAFITTDTNERHLVTLGNGVMLQELSDAPADASLTAQRLAFIALLSGQRRAPELIASGALGVAGDPAALQRLVAAVAPPPERFPIVTPVGNDVSGLDSPARSR